MLPYIPQRRSSFSEWASWIEYPNECAPNECVSPDQDEALPDPFTFCSRGRLPSTSNELTNGITTRPPLEEPPHHLFKHCLDLLISVAKEKCEFSTMQELNRCRSDLMALEPVASLTQGLAIREFVISVALRLKVSIADRLCDDEKNMSALICLIAKTEELTNQVLLLHGPAAQAVLSLIQEMLDGEALQNEGPVPFRSAIALVVRLALACNQVPANLVIKNVDILRWSPVDGGGSSDIYCGKYQDTAVAIKRLRSRGASPNIFKMVYREALLWRSARHSHVLPFLGLVDIAEFKPNVCIVSPWTSGTVDSFLREYHADPLSCIYDIATGVAYLHRLGIVHGDLRGANILVDQKLQIQIADFGLAVLAQFGGMASRGGSTRWMAPELLSWSRSFLRSTASDVYSFGCTCLELYSGQRPFSGVLGDEHVRSMVLKQERPDFSTYPIDKAPSLEWSKDSRAP
ncbi:hypothetical protein EYR40_010747 [Pleurotus pulmonarius]|nr:hypothetical protein EYR40_010747 [Pleurotus pulmonarius]